MMQILMPKLGLTMTEGTLTEWLKRPGEHVRQGDILFLFESEKATMEYEAPVDSVLGEILVKAGATVACGTAVVTLTTGSTLVASPTPPSETPTIIATPAAKRRAKELGVDLTTLVGRGPEGRVHLADVEEVGLEPTFSRSLRFQSEGEATPVARRLAADLGIDLAGIQGSGPGGRIGRDDVLIAARQALSAAPDHSPEPDRPTYADHPTYRSRRTLSGVRSVIARRMSESAFTAPHITLHTEADATMLVTARQQINEELAAGAASGAASGIKISYNALLATLVARALREHPALNACLVEDEIRIYEAINIALAVDTERGLLVPVIRDADRLDLVGIQRTGDELIQRALVGASLPDDLSGGTFTITNLGMYDVDGFTPIINQPQSAILGVGRIVSKPVDVGGQVRLRQMMALSLSFDHRIVDGGPAARFLQRVKQLIERPMTRQKILMILIENGAVLTMNRTGDTHWPGWVLVAGSQIEAVGTGEAPADIRIKADRVIDATNMAVLPGLVNAHTHLSQTFMRGLGDDKPLLTWLKQVMWPLQAVMTPDDMRLASLLGLVENLKCGVTAVNQHHKLPDPAFADATLEAAETVGLRFQLARSWVDMGPSAEQPDAIITELERLHRRWPGTDDGRITISNGPMVPWRCSDETMLRTVALARSWDAPTHIHVAEAQVEIDLMLERNGLRHIEWLASLDALGPDIQLVHCVHVSEAEIELVAESGSIVVHCPTSNMYLASGIAPVPAILRQDIPVALGTDGSASHNSQDLLETMKTAILLAKVGSGDPTALVPSDILCMATTGGARIMNRPDIGQLALGYKADITLVDLNKPHIMPVHRPDSALVYNCNGPDVHTVIVDGEVLLDAGRVTVLDELELLEECREAAGDLLRRAGINIQYPVPSIQ